MQELVNYFTNKNKFKESELFFPNLLHFVAKYKVPWILKWSYQVNWETRVLSRQFSIYIYIYSCESEEIRVYQWVGRSSKIVGMWFMDEMICVFKEF